MKKQEGMTLIALLITIVTVVVLAGITIALAISHNGILNPEKYKEYNRKMEVMEEAEKAEKEEKERLQAESSSSESTQETSEETKADDTAESATNE